MKKLELRYTRLKFKDNFYYGISSYHIGDTVTGFNQLSLFTLNFMDIDKYIKFYKSENSQFKISEFAEKNLKILMAKQTNFFNDSLKKIYTLKTDCVMKYYRIDQENRPRPDKIDTVNDIIVQRGLLKYLKTYGLPEVNLCGDTYLPILFHIKNEDVKKEYIEFFHEKVKSGEASPFTIAVLSDSGLDDKTVYGSLFVKATTQKDQERINKNRLKIGMSIYYNGPNEFPNMKKNFIRE